MPVGAIEVGNYKPYNDAGGLTAPLTGGDRRKRHSVQEDETQYALGPLSLSLSLSLSLLVLAL